MTNEKQQQPQQPMSDEERYSGIVDPDIRRWLDAQRNSPPIKKK